jgi:methylglutaconyl-CoA hydratase
MYYRIAKRLYCAPVVERVVFSKVSSTNGIAVLHLNRVEKKNALGKQLTNELMEELDSLSCQSDKIRVMILRSLVPGIFCAGADLKERFKMKEDEVPKMSDLYRKTFSRLASLPFPTIAAIDGHALGGGLEMALACDIRIASSKAKIGLVETRLAIIPGAGGTQRLPRIVGIAKAKELILTGSMLEGEEAFKAGLVNQVVKQSSSGEAAFEASLKMAEKMTELGPIALKAAKEAIDRGIQEANLSKALEIERECYQKIVPTKDRIEALQAFIAKRKPKYEGH